MGDASLAQQLPSGPSGPTMLRHLSSLVRDFDRATLALPRGRVSPYPSPQRSKSRADAQGEPRCVHRAQGWS